MKLRDPRTPNWRYRFSTEIRLASNYALIALSGDLQGITYVFRVARRDCVEFSAFNELCERIGARGLQEPQSRFSVAHVGNDEGFRDQFCHMIDDVVAYVCII